MLYLVLALVLAAFGLLIAALTTANTLWAWISVVLSVVAAALLITDWLSGRRRARAESSARPTVVTVGGNRRDDDDDRHDDRHDDRRDDRLDQRDDPLADSYSAVPETDTGFEREFERDFEPASSSESPDSETTGVIAPVVAGRPAPPVEAPARAARSELVDEDGEPLEEETDAADLLVVADLSAEVRVVDEHPRYHMANCRWLNGRGTIPIAISEGRQLGFTPCAICGPDAILAGRHRAGR